MKHWIFLSLLLTLAAQAQVLPRNTLRISHGMLGKPLLYMVGVTSKIDPQLTTTFWDNQAFQPRLVQLTSNGKTITLSDVLPHDPFTTTAQATYKIIATFPILRDDGTQIEFDFAKGMEGWGNWLMADDLGTPIPTPHSTILSSKSNAGTVIIDQQLQVSNMLINYTWILRHVFSTTLAKSTLSPRKPDETRRVGYFTTDPWYTAGNPVAHDYITRWSLDRPIRFTISRNTPEPYRDTVIQGVLDWNGAFGKDVLQLVDTPADFSPLYPQIDLGIFWSQNDKKASAHAVLFPHPQTGQMVHGDVIVFSGWVKRFEALGEQAIPEPKSTATGFHNATVCSVDNERLMLALENNPVVRDTPALRDRFIQFSLRALIRHEMGHILGLRHNFMGNLGGTMTDTDFDAVWKEFLAGSTPNSDKEPSSSEMDYLDFTYEIFMPPVASYDLKAIQWGYFASIGAIPDDNTPLFCTDENTAANGMADCMRYDWGQEPLAGIEHNLRQEIGRYIRALLKIADKSQEDLDRTAPAKLPTLKHVQSEVEQLNRYLTPNTSVRTIDGRYPLERRELAEKILDYYHAIKNWDVPELLSTASRLKQMITYGRKEDAYWAEEVLLRLVLGVKQLKSVLDAPQNVGNKPAHGTAADFDFGD